MANGVSNYAKRMALLSARIFGEVSRTTDRPSMKVVRLFSEEPYSEQRHVVDYYPKPLLAVHSLTWELRFHGLYRDEHQDFRDEMQRLRNLRGKFTTKKGEGKRALRRLSGG